MVGVIPHKERHVADELAAGLGYSHDFVGYVLEVINMLHDIEK